VGGVGLQNLDAAGKKTNAFMLCVKQIRFTIGSYCNLETTAGGNALLFYAGYRIHVGGGKAKSSRLADPGTGEIYGHKTHFFVEKNKRSAPYRSADVDLIYGMGYDTIGELVDIGVSVGLIEQAGAWYRYKEHKWQGKEKARLALHNEPAIEEELTQQIRKITSGEALVVPPEPEEAENDEIKESGKLLSKDSGEIKNAKPTRKKRAANA